MIISVADRGEGLGAVRALVRLFSCVDTHVYKQVAPLHESLITPHTAEERHHCATHVVL